MSDVVRMERVSKRYPLGDGSVVRALAGAVLGSGLVLSATAELIGTITTPVVAIAAAVAAGGVASCMIAAVVPALWIRGLPTAQILAGE